MARMDADDADSQKSASICAIYGNLRLLPSSDRAEFPKIRAIRVHLRNPRSLPAVLPVSIRIHPRSLA